MTKESVMQNTAELRTNQRHELNQPIPVIDTMNNENLGALVNINSDGLMIVCSNPLDVNRIYQIKLDLPEAINDSDSIELGIDCLWLKSGEAHGVNWAGCSIIDADEPTSMVIEQLVQRYSTDNR